MFIRRMKTNGGNEIYQYFVLNWYYISATQTLNANNKQFPYLKSILKWKLFDLVCQEVGIFIKVFHRFGSVVSLSLIKMGLLSDFLSFLFLCAWNTFVNIIILKLILLFVENKEISVINFQLVIDIHYSISIHLIFCATVILTRLIEFSKEKRFSLI